MGGTRVASLDGEAVEGWDRCVLVFVCLFNVCLELVWSLWVLECWIQDEVVGAAMKHPGGKVAHEGARLQAQVPHHGVTLPPAEEFDDVGVHLCAKQGHGAPGAEGAGRDVLGSDAELVPDYPCRGAKGFRDISGVNGAATAMAVIGG
jgi:hypothetical protein